METRAAHILVGFFVLLCLAGLVAFSVWVAKVELDATYDDYDIIFEGSVSGLQNRSTIFYNGIAVGNVNSIRLDPLDPSRVRVWVRVRSEVPVTQQSVARLEFQGFTGVAYIDLAGGAADAPPIVAGYGEERPVIPSEASSFQALFANTPELLKTAIDTLERVQALLNDGTLQDISETIAHVNEITAQMDAASRDLPALMTEVGALVVEAKATAAAVTRLSEAGTAVVNGELKTLLITANETLTKSTDFVTKLEDMVDKNEPAVTQFVNSSLPEVSRMIRDLRQTGRSLSRLTRRIERNPVDALFGGEKQEYNLETRSVEDK